jgi:hypothetical protein
MAAGAWKTPYQSARRIASSTIRALRFEYRSVKPRGSGPDDACTVHLQASWLV